MTRNDVFVGDRRVLRRYIGDRLIFDDLSNKTDILSGNEIFTDKADEGATVHVGVDGESYQHVNPNARNMIPTAYKDWEDGHYSPSGTKEPYVDRIRVPRLVKVEPSTTYHWNSGNSSAQFVIRSFDSSGAFSGSWGGVSSSGSRTTSSSEHYLGIALFNTSDYEEKFSNGTIKPLFQLASHSDKSFEEFIPPAPSPDYPIEIHSLNDFDVVSSVGRENLINLNKINLLLDEPLRSIGDVKDRLFRDTDGLWKVERNVGEASFDGSESWTHQASSNHFYRAFSDKNKDGQTPVMSNSHRGYWDSGNYPLYDNVFSFSGNSNIGFKTDGITTEQAWKDKIASMGGLTILYTIDPIIETLPQTLQYKLNNLRSFKDSNYVYTVLPDESNIIQENLKPTLHATFKSIGWETFRKKVTKEREQ